MSITPKNDLLCLRSTVSVFNLKAFSMLYVSLDIFTTVTKCQWTTSDPSIILGPRFQISPKWAKRITSL
jgi:hypothetical protein